MVRDRDLERRFADAETQQIALRALEHLIQRDHEFLIEAAARILRPGASPTAQCCVEALWKRLRHAHRNYSSRRDKYHSGVAFRGWAVAELRDVFVECWFAAGNRVALAELVLLDHQWLVQEATGFQRPGLVWGPEEAVQDVWTKLTEQLGMGKYDCGMAFRPWVKAVLCNLIRDRAKRKKNWTASRFLAILRSPRSTASSAPLQLALRQLICNADQEQRINSVDIAECLAHLTPEMQEALHLRFDCDLEYREMVEMTGISSGTWGSLVHRAIRRLRERIRVPNS